MGGTTDATGGGLLVVVALIEGVLFKTVLKGLPLPYTCIMLILGGTSNVSQLSFVHNIRIHKHTHDSLHGITSPIWRM